MAELFSKTTTQTQDTAQNTFEPSTEKTLNEVNPQIEIPPSIAKEPISTEVFGFKTADRDKALFIDEYINQVIKSRGLTDSLKSYHSIADELCQALGIDENELGYQRFLKVYQLCSFLAKLAKSFKN